MPVLPSTASQTVVTVGCPVLKAGGLVFGRHEVSVGVITQRFLPHIPPADASTYVYGVPNRLLFDHGSDSRSPETAACVSVHSRAERLPATKSRIKQRYRNRYRNRVIQLKSDRPYCFNKGLITLVKWFFAANA